MLQRAYAHRPKRSLIALPAILVLALALFVMAPAAYADPDPVAEKQAEAQAALQSLNTMLAELDQANADYAAALGKQEQAKNLMNQTEARIKVQNGRIQNFQRQLGSRIRSMYRMGGGATFLDVFFGSTTFLNFATNWDLLNDMSFDDAQLVEKTRAERDRLAALEAEYAKQKASADIAASEAERIRNQANETAKRMQETYDSLSAEAAELLAEQQKRLAEEAAAAAEEQARTEAQQQALSAAMAAGQVQAAGGFDYSYTADDSAGQAVAISDISSFDESTGTATLSDGTTAKVVGYDTNTGNAIVDLAASFVGGSYQWGAEDPTTSTFDCSGLVQYVYAQNGITVGGHNDRAILNAGTVIDSSEAQAGDILWWDGHVAIYAGDNMMISADNEQYGITYREVSDGATYVRY